MRGAPCAILLVAGAFVLAAGEQSELPPATLRESVSSEDSESAQSAAALAAGLEEQLSVGHIRRFHNKFKSIESSSRPKQYMRAEGLHAVVSKLKVSPEKQEATFKLSEGLGNTEGVSFQAIKLPGYYLMHSLPTKKKQGKSKLLKRYPVSVKKNKTREPQMSQMTFFVKPALEKGKDESKGWVSFEVVKNDEFNRPGWFLRELNNKLFLEHNDGSSTFAKAATFRVGPPKWKVCPGKSVCSGRGECVNIQNAKGKCQCSRSFTGKACQKSVLKIKQFKSSAKFDYFGPKGPSNWHTLDKKWKACKGGTGNDILQSPIPFKQQQTLIPLVNSQFVSMHYKKSPFRIVRKGKEIKVILEAKGQNHINTGGFEYDLSHMEIHAPGEHAVSASINPNCQSGTCPYDMEIHLIHTKRKTTADLGKGKKKKGDKTSELGEQKTPVAKKRKLVKKKKTANGVVKKLIAAQVKAKAKKPVGKQITPQTDIVIIAIPFKIGSWPNKLLTKLLATMPKRDKSAKAKGSLDLFYELPKIPTYYRYEGSLTKPPCTQGVMWYVFAQPLECSVDQVQKFYNTNSANSRPTQNVNYRKIWSAFTMQQLEEMTEEAELEAESTGDMGDEEAPVSSDEL